VWVALSVLAGVVPRAAAGDEARRTYEELFGEEARKVRATGSTADDAALAAKLLDSARTVSDAPKLQAVLCEKTYEFGARNRASYPAALEAMRMLAEVAPERKSEAQEKALTVHELRYRYAHGREKLAIGRELLESLLTVADHKTASGGAEKAVALYRRALSVASAIRSGNRKQISAKLAGATARQKVEREIVHLEKRVQSDPADAAAAERLAVLYVRELNDPAKAAPLLDALAGSGVLRTYVPLAAKKTHDVPAGACLELGQWYERLAAAASPVGKLGCLLRAADYYDHYLQAHAADQADRLKAAIALGRVREQLTRLGHASKGGPRGSVLVMTFDKGSFYKKKRKRYVRDLSGKGNAASVRGVTAVEGKVGEAIRLDANSLVTVPHSESLRFTDAITVMAWIKTTGPGAIAHQNVVKSDGNFKFGIWPNALVFGRSPLARPSKVVADGRWHHVAGVYDREDGWGKHYVDGERVRSYADTSRLPDRKIPLTIGREASGEWKYTGLIDELAIFNRALSANEIKSHYEAGKKGTSLVK